MTIQERLAKALNALPDVFSSVQWGGRAYKLPGPGGSRKKPKLLAHVTLAEDGKAVFIDFKLKKVRAAEVIRQHAWIAPHSFRTLAPSGWIATEVRTLTQCRIVIELLKESRALYPHAAEPSKNRNTSASGKDTVARRIDHVMREREDAGWRPQRDM
jgi:hypothetical protein